MALINCPECGREISDTAENCPGCGIPLKRLVKCSDCGKYLLDSEMVCCNCGKRVSDLNDNIITGDSVVDRKVLNSKKTLGSILAIVIIVIAVLLFSKFSQKENGLFEDHAWGTSYSDLSNALEKKNGKTPNGDGESNLFETIENYGNMDGIEAGVVYQFGRTGLSSVIVFLTFYSTDYTSDDVSEIMREKLNKTYGEGKPLKSGMLTLEYQTEWTTENSIISLVNYSEDMVVIEYSPN